MAISEPSPFQFVPRPTHGVGLAVAQVLLLAGSLLAGYGIGCTVIDANEDAPASYVAGDDIGIATIGGCIIAVVGLVMWSFMVDSHPLAVGQLHSWGTSLPAGAFGLLIATSHLGAGDTYALVAIGLAIAGAVAMVLGCVAVSRRRRRYRHELDLIARGTAVPATVLDSGLDPDDFEEASNVITTVTFRFVIGDHAYRLNRRMTIPQHGLVLEGQRTTVWYDPADPTDDRAMVVAMQHALRWNVPVPRVADVPPVTAPDMESGHRGPGDRARRP
jgi:hypothetical protein